MMNEDYANLQRVFEKQEAEKATGKVIIFFEDGVAKAVEVTNKAKLIGLIVHIVDSTK